MRKPWKKSFRKIPKLLLQKVKGVAGKGIVVGCVKKIPASDFESGTYEHLGITLVKGQLKHPSSIVPAPIVGRASAENALESEIVRRDLPKIPKTFSFEAPNWGDWSNGSHYVEWDRYVYRREWRLPKENKILIDSLGQEQGNGDTLYVMRFRIAEVLKPGGRRFKENLLSNLNLLQRKRGCRQRFPGRRRRQ